MTGEHELPLIYIQMVFHMVILCTSGKRLKASLLGRDLFYSALGHPSTGRCEAKGSIVGTFVGIVSVSPGNSGGEHLVIVCCEHARR